MRKSFRIWPPNEPGAIIRLIVAVLIVANLVAGYFVLRPIGGSPEELRNQVADLRVQMRQRQNTIARTRQFATKIEAGRSQGDEFMDDYFLPRRIAYSSVLAELNQAATTSHLKPKEAAFATEPIEGSDTLTMMQISANFEGNYADLIRFINLIDKSESLMIIEGLNATPQQGSGTLNVTLKLDTFVREDGSAQNGPAPPGSAL
ncbi:MAG: type 4a pilus biogenesis protein PilO [Acidobacteriota bacterium]|nr:type 4a pilus biogenesis protein PilO [Acidobacteriota bacterium]